MPTNVLRKPQQVHEISPFCRLGYFDEKNNEYHPIMSQVAKMTVTSLQLAIISGQISVVEELLAMVPMSNDQYEGEAKLSIISGQKATVEFLEGIEKYGEGDRMLHGCSAFYLAARFHAESLKLFIDLFKNNSSKLQELIAEKSTDHPMKLSPLHLAACNVSSKSLRYA